MGRFFLFSVKNQIQPSEFSAMKDLNFIIGDHFTIPNVQDQNKNQRKLETFWTNIKGRWSYCAIKGTDNNPLIICAFRDAIFWSGIDSFPFKDCILSWHALTQSNMTCLVPAYNIDWAWMCNACYKLRTFPMQNRVELVVLVLYCQHLERFNKLLGKPLAVAFSPLNWSYK